MKYQGLVARELGSEREVVCSVEELDTERLPEGDLLVRVRYSSLNYKDALSATGNRGVTKRYPHTPGIDACGVVVESRSGGLREGDEVIVTGFDLGMNTPGGFGEYIRVPSSWAVPLPALLSGRQAMCYGTAGLTAAIALERLQGCGMVPDGGRGVVTGATGGVGGFATALLSKVGYEVDAVTGKREREPYLRALGASSVIARDELNVEEGRPMLHSRWAVGVDTVGGAILSNVIKAVGQGGAVAVCGNVAAGDFAGSVYPLILRSVSVLGVDSASYPTDRRVRLWEALAGPWNILDAGFDFVEAPLSELPERISAMLRGGSVGRIVVNLSP